MVPRVPVRDVRKAAGPRRWLEREQECEAARPARPIQTWHTLYSYRPRRSQLDRILDYCSQLPSFSFVHDRQSVAFLSIQPSASQTLQMAPLGEQLVDQLKGTVDKLEARVAELEARLQGKASGSSASSPASEDGMRMIIMGPPGAGMSSTQRESLAQHVLTILRRQGYSGSQDKGQVLRLPPGMDIQPSCREDRS